MSDVNNLRAQRLLERLRMVTAELSGCDAKDLAATATFLELGFDSLFLTQLAAAFQNECGVKITFRQLFDELPTLKALADHIDRSLPAEAPPAVVPAAGAEAPPEVPALTAAATAVPTSNAPLAMATAMPLVTTARLGAVQAVMAQQLALMSRQLQLLQGARGVAALPPAVAAVPAAAAATAAAATAPVLEREAPEKPALPKGFGPQVSREERTLTPRQRDHLDRLIARYNAKTIGSKRRTQAHRAHHADPRTAAGFNRLWKEMVYPIVVERSSGCRLWDVDGNEYIDMLNGFGPNFLGHSPDYVKQALLAQIDKGIEVGPQTPLAGEAAKLFCELTGMDRVSWVNTGSEAVQAAIRLSRTITGRNKIVVFSGDYHGNFDEVLVRVTNTASGRRTLPLAPGIPFRAVEDVLVLDYGTDESIEIIRKHAKEIAAVLVEPVQSRRPDFQPREFLHELRRLTAHEGIVLVFDEVITGFRIGPGGAQAHYGVEADLATYGKIVGGGMPIGVVAGRARFMDTFDGGMWQYGDDSFPSAGVTFFAGTFVRHPLAIAAAHAALTHLKAQGPALQEAVNQRTTRYAGELNRFFQERGVRIRIPHFASQMFIKVEEDSELATLLFYHLRDRGVHLLEGFPTYMTAAHGDADVERVIAAMKDSVFEMQADDVLPRPANERSEPAWRRTLPLTAAQHEVWLASQLGDMASCAFNESDSIAIDGPLDAALFARTAAAVLARHEAFRLRFDRDGTSQSVDPHAVFDVPLVDLSGVADHQRSERFDELIDREALTSFDIERGPLVRATLVKLSAQSHVFVIYCHHIVFDGYSSELLMREIARAYSAAKRGEPLPPSNARPFSVFAERVRQHAAGESANESLAYWRAVYVDEPPAPLELPTDRPRGSQRSYHGATVHREVDAALSQALRQASKGLGASLNAVLLSAFQTLISRLSAQEDVVVGVPAAGQAWLETATVGYCVNALPLRAATRHDKPFAQLVKESQSALLRAVEHQGASLGTIVGALGLPRDPSRLPLVEVVFNHSRYFADINIADCEVSARENHRRAIHYDLFFNVVESGSALVIDCDYCSELFDAATIERWIDHYCELLRGVCADGKQSLGELPLLSAQQGADVIAMWGRR
jgi:glutamate-1-semialdehyde aminotransferase/acyl carrier protein